MVGKAALEAAVTSKSQAWRGPSSPTSRYKVEKFIREYNFLVEILIWANIPKHAVYRWLTSGYAGLKINYLIDK